MVPVTVFIPRTWELLVICGVIIIFATALLFPVKEGFGFVDPGSAGLVAAERDIERL